MFAHPRPSVLAHPKARHPELAKDLQLFLCSAGPSCFTRAPLHRGRSVVKGKRLEMLPPRLRPLGCLADSARKLRMTGGFWRAVAWHACRSFAVLALVMGVAFAADAPPIDQLVEQLSAQGNPARREAAYQLEKLGPAAKPALPALIKALDDPDKQVWSYAVAAIAGLGPDAADAIPALIEDLDGRKSRGRRDRDKRQVLVRSAFALSRIGPAAIPPLIAVLDADDSPLRAGAAKALGGMGPAAKQAIPALRENLGHGDEVVRQESIEAIALIGPASVAPLIEMLGWKEPVQRASAALALAELGRVAAAAAPALTQLLAKEGDATVRAAALSALPKVSPEPAKAVPLLIEGVKSDDNAIRHAASNALLLIRPAAKTTVPPLVAMLKDANADHAQRAASLLGRLGAEARDAAPELIALAQKQQPPSPPLIEALAQLGTAAIPALITAFTGLDPDALTKEHWLVQSLRTPGAVQPLAAALSNAKVEIRFGAARTLGELSAEGAPAIKELLAAADDADPRVRAMTLGALAGVGAEPRVMLPKLDAALSDSVPVVRLTALQLVPYLGADASPLLARVTELTRDREPAVQNAARQVLEHFAPK